eukprot:237987-Pleurochrysis_carterae.AAC.1
MPTRRREFRSMVRVSWQVSRSRLFCPRRSTEASSARPKKRLVADSNSLGSPVGEKSSGSRSGSHMVRKRKWFYMTNRSVTPELTDMPSRETQRALLIRMLPCASGYQLNPTKSRTKMHKCQCPSMQMRVHSDQARNSSTTYDL